MNQTIEKLRKLESVFSFNNEDDKVLNVTIEKILQREINKLQSKMDELNNQIKQFEKTYSMNSTEFRKQFENGSIGDDIDFIEWEATLEMKEKADGYLRMLY